MKKIWQMIILIGIQYSLGRRGSYPYGLMVGFNALEITAAVVVSDIIQTVLLLNLSAYSMDKIKRLKWKYRKKKALEDNIENVDNIDNINNGGFSIKKERKKKRFMKWMNKYGSAGLVIIAALPFGGGALTSSIVAVSLKIDKKKAFALITTGCIAGTMLYFFGITGLVSFFK